MCAQSQTKELTELQVFKVGQEAVQTRDVGLRDKKYVFISSRPYVSECYKSAVLHGTGSLLLSRSSSPKEHP
jgi:hypothetical protein